jgi:predicted PilT family ATPase
MIRSCLAAVAAIVIAMPAVAADKVDAKKVKGKWSREVDGNSLIFEFKDEKTMHVHLKPAGADKAAIVKCEIKLEADGKLTGKITEVEKNGLENAPPAGEEFGFKIEVGEKKLIISEFKGPGDDGAKQLVEGEYKKHTD